MGKLVVGTFEGKYEGPTEGLELGSCVVDVVGFNVGSTDGA